MVDRGFGHLYYDRRSVWWLVRELEGDRKWEGEGKEEVEEEEEDIETASVGDGGGW